MTKEPFFDRHEELRFFRERYLSLTKGEFIVFYGRRRLGKTKLIRRFLDEVKSKKIYSFVNIVDEKDLMKNFEADILNMTGDILKIDRWADLFEYIYEEAKKEKCVLVIDEFQRLKSIAPGFISELQNYWDTKLKTAKLMLIIVGSSIGMMRKIAISASAPLYGRKTAAIQLHPFRYVDFREMFADRTEEEKIRWYAVFGGTPYYLELVYQTQDIYEAMSKAFLDKNSPLREEVRNLLELELRSLERYNSILQGIAQGKESIKELADTTHVKSVTLPKYLKNLIFLLDLVKQKTPLRGKAKSSKYVLSDNFFKFWYRFIFPNQSALEFGNTKLVLDKIKENIESCTGNVFEDIVREVFVLYNGGKIKDLELNFSNIGSWWDRASNEIDLVIENKNELILGEVKWTNKPMDAGVLDDLMRKTQLVSHHGRIKYVLVSKNGFTDSCEKLATRTNTTLLNLKELEQLFKAATNKHIERQKMLLQ